MKIVIDIPENVFKRLVAGEVQYGGITARNIFKSVTKGTPLPEGHGDLISREALKEDFADMREGYPIFSDTEMLSTKDIAKIIDNAPTVIKADK